MVISNSGTRINVFHFSGSDSFDLNNSNINILRCSNDKYDLI